MLGLPVPCGGEAHRASRGDTGCLRCDVDGYAGWYDLERGLTGFVRTLGDDANGRGRSNLARGRIRPLARAKSLDQRTQASGIQT
jgi:hypothetical protein